MSGQPFLRVVKGEPDDAELAALTAAMVALAAGGEAGAGAREPRVRSRWSDRGAMTRVPLRHGPGAWRASAF
ncbi:MAG TPA: acyl-CoA carboxylase subunit epsilon [Actinophytocola sp.]|nr:acyl-CoA carboxylase subunit epsilon [Actinophytocola sp.]